jgi:FMN phosphatase YigB (HAD superfamily)
MNPRPQLVLDVAGVIVTNLSSSFWEGIARISQTSFATISERFKQEVREALWTGRMSETEFWAWLCRLCPRIEPEEASLMLLSQLTHLPTIHSLEGWSRTADIHLLSNHRHEWLQELLQPIRSYIHSVTISSQVGCCKPDPSIYRVVQSLLKSDHVIYVDDQERNLAPAREMGWTTILADENGLWTVEVNKRLESIA